MNPWRLYLVQSDTTVGFLSRDAQKLALAKQRDPAQPFLISTAYFRIQKDLARTPRKYRREVRRARKTTYLYPNKKAIRVVSEGPHHHFLEKFTWLYSTSANLHGAPFDYEYALSRTDIIVEDRRGFYEGEASAIFRIGKRKKSRLR